MPRTSVLWLLGVLTVTAVSVFVALTIAVTVGSPVAPDSRAFEVAAKIGAPWRDTVARVVTNMGLMVIVGPAVIVGAAVMIKHHDPIRAAWLVVGAGMAWLGVTLVKSVVDRPRPPHALVHTSGQSYPSAHAANSVGWLALAIALTVVIPTRTGRIAAIIAGLLLAGAVGLSRIYLRAHYASDVLAGEAFAIAMYAGVAIGAIAW